MTPRVSILECTLRDSSYSVAFQFTIEDTAVISAGLERCGFREIEVGHGLGLGASGERLGMAAAPDEDYITAAVDAVSHASIGVFCIPGIATLDDVGSARRCGAGFIRIGTDATRTDEALPYVERAKADGFQVSANLMKSYAVSPSEIVKRGRDLRAAGADVIAVVDSAGGMLPGEVSEYVTAVRDGLGCAVGFHGHNNLQLAVANCLAAVDAGATVVDSTLRGMGRSTGNAQTEVLIAVMERRGIDTGLDLYKTMDLAERIIAPLAQGRGSDGVEVASGFALFHSSYLGLVEGVAADEGVDVRRLIVAVCDQSRVSVDEEGARRCARQLRARPDGADASKDLPLPRSRSREDRTPTRAKDVADELYALAKKSHRRSLFTVSVVNDSHSVGPSFPFIRGDSSNVMANVEAANIDQALDVIADVDGAVDFILVDGTCAVGASLVERAAVLVQRSQLAIYGDEAAQVDATDALITHLMGAALVRSFVGLCGRSRMGDRLAVSLSARGASVAYVEGRDGIDERVDVLVGTAMRSEVITRDLVGRVVADGLIIDAGIGTITSDALDAIRDRGLRALRLDMRAGLFGQVTTVMETARLATVDIGQAVIDGVPVVAGGVIGESGAVVVDSVSTPTRVLGVADGRGRLLTTPEDLEPFQDAVSMVSTGIVNRLLGST